MGKIHISDDLKSKLDKVLGLKNQDMSETDNIKTGPAPVWKGNKEIPTPPPPPPLQKEEVKQNNNFIKSTSSIKPKKKKKVKKRTKIKTIFIMFGGSVVIGIGLTLGFKLGKIIFY